MRNISETFRKPPRNGERFHDGDRTVEFKILDKIDEAAGLSTCDYCCFDDGDDATCDGGNCNECYDLGNYYPCPGYYKEVNVDKE